MIVQEIFNSTAVRSIEEQILDLYHETERKHWCNDENKKAIKSLLEVRRRILNSMFVLDEQNKQLLADFNEAMKLQLIEMRKRAIDLYNSVYKPDMSITVTTRSHTTTPFYNGAVEIKEQYMRIYGFDYKKRAVLQMILSLRRFVKTLCPSDAEACAWIAREII